MSKISFWVKRIHPLDPRIIKRKVIEILISKADSKDKDGLEDIIIAIKKYELLDEKKGKTISQQLAKELLDKICKCDIYNEKEKAERKEYLDSFINAVEEIELDR